MPEERQGMDPTRRMLRVFGVTVTEYEERTGALLERAKEGSAGTSALRGAEELVGLAGEVMELTAKLNERLREVADHLLEMENRVLRELKEVMERGQRV